MYLSCGIFPNITFVVEQLNYHNLDLQVRYLCIAKQILRFLKSTITLDIK